MLRAMPTLTQKAHRDVQIGVGKLNSPSSRVSSPATPLDFGNPLKNTLERNLPIW